MPAFTSDPTFDLCTTKAQKQRLARKLLYSQPLKKPFSPEKQRVLLCLFSSHPRAQQKLQDLQHITVHLNTSWGRGTREFVVIDHRGNETPISYRKCINAPDAYLEFVKACRHSIVNQILRFKRDAFTKNMYTRCPLSNAIISTKSSDVDHIIPFRQLVAKFIVHKNWTHKTLDKIGYLRPTRGGVQFEDRKLDQEFQDYHARHARLRVVGSRANRKRN